MTFTTTILLLLLHVQSGDAFQPTLPNTPFGLGVFDLSTALCAKAKSKKNKKTKKNDSSSASSGGFGKVVSAASGTKTKPPSTPKNNKSIDEDFSVFPELDPQVSETLIPAPASLQEESGCLPVEIYDRLDQIYGFPNFNYETPPTEGTNEEGDNTQEVSFGDLLASSADASSGSQVTGNSNTSGSLSDTDFADLLAAATGGKVESPLQTTTSQSTVASPTSSSGEVDMGDAISKLPPFEEFRVLHVDPLVLAIDDFFSDAECDRYVEMSISPPSASDINDKPQIESFQTRSKTVGKDESAKSQRTSTTWFHHYKNVPELMAKASRLVGLDTIDRWEEPQTVRYRRNEKFTWHLDALAPGQATPEQGGQRLATLLVYLKDLESGGATIFRDLTGLDSGPLRVQPKKGSALLFFPAAGGIPNTPFDIRTLHCGEIVKDSSECDKWISQLWLRANKYSPTAPPGNMHESALESVRQFCFRQHEFEE